MNKQTAYELIGASVYNIVRMTTRSDKDMKKYGKGAEWLLDNKVAEHWDLMKLFSLVYKYEHTMYEVEKDLDNETLVKQLTKTTTELRKLEREMGLA